MVNVDKRFKIIGAILVVAGILAASPFVIYLKVLPAVVSNDKAISFAEKTLNKYTKLTLDIKSPVLKTSMTPVIAFKVKQLSLYNKDKEKLICVENFDTEINFKDIFNKNIIIDRLGADYIFADVNKLETLVPKQQKKQEKSEWNVDFYDSLLYIKKSLFLYKIEPNTYVTLYTDNLSVNNKQKDIRYVHFNISAKIQKADKNLLFNINDRNAVYIKNKAIYVQDCYLTFNRSKIFFNAWADKKKNFTLDISSPKIHVSDVLTLINSKIIDNNLDEPLAFFKDLKGDFNFKISITNNSLSGIVYLNKISCKVIPVNNIPMFIKKGKIIMTKNDITLKDFDGYYNNRAENKVTMTGTVKDYLKSIDTNITARAVVTNDFMKNYLSKMVAAPIELVGGSTRTRLDIKSKYNKIDLVWLFGLKRGQDILIDNASLTPADYIRGLKADMHFENNILNLKSIDYYILPHQIDREKIKKIQPVIKLSGNIDCSNGTKVQNIGFVMPRPLPSEFLNLFVGQQLFKKGTIAGHLDINNMGKYPVLNGKLTMDKVRIPSQRISLHHGELNASKGIIKLAAAGRYRRANYDFSGELVNEIKLPLVAKNMNLTIDNVDIERFMASANKQKSDVVEDSKFVAAPSGVAKDDDDDTPTFDIGSFVVENSTLNILKGSYKDIEFSDIKANMTLDRNSVFNLYSNRFAIAEGHSSVKVNCNLKKHKYNLTLGIKDVNSDLIATTILQLKREISGKASGLIELNTDDSLKLNGSIKFIVKNGQIQKIGMVEYILKVAALFRNPLVMISPSTFSDLVNMPDGRFDKITGTLEIKDNIIGKMMIKSYASQLSAFIAGKYNMETSDASLRIYTKFSNKNKGVAGFLRNISLNSLANRIPLSSRNDINYYSAEISQLPPIDANEKDCQIFLTKVDGDVEHNNFLSSLKKIK